VPGALHGLFPEELLFLGFTLGGQALLFGFVGP
jgi:hypothetical protein